VAAAVTRGDVLVENAVCDHLKPVIAKLRERDIESPNMPKGFILWEDIRFCQRISLLLRIRVFQLICKPNLWLTDLVNGNSTITETFLKIVLCMSMSLSAWVPISVLMAGLLIYRE
jgi:hypothetical protein